METTRFVGLSIAAALLAACSGGGGGAPSGDGGAEAEAQREVMGALGAEVILPTYQRFEAAAGDLSVATAAWAESDASEDRDIARDAWREAMAVWQEAEVFQVGPAAVQGEQPGGEDLRDEIYSWPITNHCLIDQATAAGDPGNLETLREEPVRVRGLDALEYLLFHGEADGEIDHACRSDDLENIEPWADLDADEILRRRADYAAAAAQLVEERAAELVQAWSPEGGDFPGEFATAGTGSEIYGSAREALNGLTDGLYYLETETKDLKLRPPVGLKCSEGETCPEEVEHVYARVSAESIAANLRGFRAIFLGSAEGEAGLGFYRLLTDADAQPLADRMAANLDAAIATADGLEGSLYDAVEADHAAALALHDAVKAVTDDLKTEFVLTLMVDVPDNAAGDGD